MAVELLQTGAVERGRLKPVLFRRVQQAGRASLVCATRESHLRWEA